MFPHVWPRSSLPAAAVSSAEQSEQTSIIKLHTHPLLHSWSREEGCCRVFITTSKGRHQKVILYQQLTQLQVFDLTPSMSAAPSVMSHRFVTVRRGSPAARSGHIQPGDQLEAVEGRPVGGLQHRDLAQILRRAGNTLRLSITPRQRTHTHTHSSN